MPNRPRNTPKYPKSREYRKYCEYYFEVDPTPQAQLSNDTSNATTPQSNATPKLKPEFYRDFENSRHITTLTRAETKTQTRMLSQF